MDSDDFTIQSALDAAQSLRLVLERRTHRKKYLGEEYNLPSTLGDAVNLPKITSMLKARAVNQRDKGLIEFQNLWLTLSESTREQVMKEIGWYDLDELEWDDIRSNRRPKLGE